MRRISMAFAAALLSLPPILVSADQSTASRPAQSTRFELTVDSIMRGPDLVGHPPGSLRWSADSANLYFSWRKPGEEESSTYVVGRDGGTPRKLPEEEARNVPPAGGDWDEARRRVLFEDDGDIAHIYAQTRRRRQITPTTGAESNPEHARAHRPRVVPHSQKERTHESDS